MTKLAPTGEQHAIVEAAVAGKNLVIQAGAGTGKTSTLKLIASALESKPTLYVAYNRAIADEAKKSFPQHVTCRTAHSLAYAAVGQRFAPRLNGPRELPSRRAEILETRWLNFSTELSVSPIQMARIAVETVTRFCYSADEAIAAKHVPRQRGIVGADHDTLVHLTLPKARKAWADINDEDGLLKVHHDHYLKIWALTRPRLDARVVMLDEAQDSNPAVAHLVQSQSHAQQIAVGDSNQSMYEWRGAVDALGAWGADEQHYLSQSWRFGPAISAEANRWLTELRTPLRLTGNPDIRSAIGPVRAPRAVLCRTNAEAIIRVQTLLSQGRKVALAGGSSDIRRLAEAANDLKNGRRTSHPELYVFASWAALRDYVDTDPSGRDLKPFVDLIDAHGVDAIVRAVEALVDESVADTVVSTVHKAKGREWDTVLIADDFSEPLDAGDIPKADAMLAYVAVTRARTRLDRGGLSWIDHRRRPRRGTTFQWGKANGRTTHAR